jgi:hypothetical protein
MVLWDGRFPGPRVLSLPTHPLAIQGRNTLGLGSLWPPGAVKGWALARLQLRGGPGRRESKAAMWALLSSPGFKEVQTNPVPVPGGGGGSSSLLTAPTCSSPSSPPSQKASRAWVLLPAPGLNSRLADDSKQGLLGRNGEFCQAGTCIWSHCTPDLELGAHTPCQSLPV